MPVGKERLKYKLNGRGSRIYGPKRIQYIYNVKQAAEFCECTEDCIRDWVERGMLPAFRQLVDPEIDVLTARTGRLYFQLSDLRNALAVGLRVPTEGFNA